MANEHCELIGGQFVGSVFHKFNTRKVEVDFFLVKNERNVTNCFNVSRTKEYISWSLDDYLDLKKDSVMCVIRKRKWRPEWEE